MSLDNVLRRTFRRTPAPPDLADKVLARIAEGDVSGVNATGRLPPSPQSGFGAARTSAPTFEDGQRERGVRRWLAAAAAVTLMAAGGARYYVYQQTVAYQQNVAEAERVQAEILVALQITGEKLALVQRKVEDSQR